MGNCLYDKAYTQEVVKIKVTPVRIMFWDVVTEIDGFDFRPNLTRANSIDGLSFRKKPNLRSIVQKTPQDHLFLYLTLTYQHHRQH
jgi:recombination DNA repair RAD52 pathway protein